MSEAQAVDLDWVLAVIRRWWWLILGCTLLGVISAVVVTVWIPPVYSASTTLLIQPAQDSGMSGYQTVLTGEMMARTYTEMLQQDSVFEAAVEKAQLRESPAALASKVEVDPVPDTQLIRLSVQSNNPALAALLANAIAETFIQRIEALQQERSTDSLTGLESQIAELSTQIEAIQQRIIALGTPTTSEKQVEMGHLEDLLTGYRGTHATLLQNYEQMRLAAAREMQSVAIAEAAQPPEDPEQNRLLYAVVAGLVGAMVGMGAAFLLEKMEDTIRTPQDVKQVLDLNTLGIITRMSRAERGLIVTAQPQSGHAEAFRILCSNVGFYGEHGLPRTILVTSPSGAEGKSLISANLAMIPALAGLRAVAVDADMRRPKLARFFDLDPQIAGFSRALQAGSVDGLLRPTQVAQLAILTSGALPADPAPLLASPHLQEVLEELAQRADVILIDGPPMLAVADTALMARRMDGVLLVLRAGRTQRSAAQSAVENLALAGANVIGVVLNDVDPGKSLYHSTYHRYGAYAKVEGLPAGEQAQDRAPDRTVVAQPAKGQPEARAFQAAAGPARVEPAEEIVQREIPMLSAQDAAALPEGTTDGRPSGLAISSREEAWEAEYKAFTQRELSEVQVEYLFLDLLRKPLPSPSGDEEDAPCAWAIAADGRSVLLHIASCSVESHEMWLGFLRDMVARGLPVPALAIADGNPGVMRAVSEVFPNSLHQRCLARRIRAVSDEIPGSARAEVRAMVQAAYYAPNFQVAETISADMSRLYEERYPSALRMFQSDWDTCIAYLRCPPAHHSRIRTTTFLQRCFAKERQQILDSLQAHAEEGSLELVFALLWQCSRRWQGLKMGEAEREHLRLLRQELGLVDG